MAVLTELAERHRGERILVVSHGGIIESLFREALGLSLPSMRRYSLYNAAINRFGFDGGSWYLISWGDISHLRRSDVTDAGKSHTVG